MRPRICTDSHGLRQRQLTEQIMGIFYDVYNELGHGFLESIYQQAMLIALRAAGLKVEPQAPIPVWFRGDQIGEFRADLIVNDSVLVELKAARALDETHEAQLLHYLRATPIEIGLLFNFGVRPQFKRLVFDNDRKKIREDQCKSAAK